MNSMLATETMEQGFRWIGMSQDGEEVKLRRFNGSFRLSPDHVDPKEVRTGIVVDLETTGVSYSEDKVIEVGIREFKFNRKDGEIVSIHSGFNALQDPEVPLSDVVISLTGLTDEILAEQKVNWNEVTQIFKRADIVIAHNARFDRPFIERHIDISKEKIWSCTHRQIDWGVKGFNSPKLELLSIYHGFFTKAHRALNDADALLHLLTHRDPNTNTPYLNELLINARRPMVKVIANHSPFEMKDKLKRRGYLWDSGSRTWQRSLYKDEISNEIEWMEKTIYTGDFLGNCVDIPQIDLFKSQT